MLLRRPDRHESACESSKRRLRDPSQSVSTQSVRPTIRSDLNCQILHHSSRRLQSLRPCTISNRISTCSSWNKSYRRLRFETYRWQPPQSTSWISTSRLPQSSPWLHAECFRSCSMPRTCIPCHPPPGRSETVRAAPHPKSYGLKISSSEEDALRNNLVTPPSKLEWGGRSIRSTCWGRETVTVRMFRAHYFQ